MRLKITNSFKIDWNKFSTREKSCKIFKKLPIFDQWSVITLTNALLLRLNRRTVYTLYTHGNYNLICYYLFLSPRLDYFLPVLCRWKIDLPDACYRLRGRRGCDYDGGGEVLRRLRPCRLYRREISYSEIREAC